MKLFGLSQRLYSERVKKAVRSELDNRIPAMQVRSRPDERHGKHARTDSVSCLERVFLTGKRHGQPFRQDSGRGNNDTRYRLPTRQMGWPTLGCNQQDPRRASERLSSKSLLPAWFPKRRGRAANRRIRIKTYFNSDCRKHDVDGESVRRRNLRRISLPPTFRSVT